MSGYSSLTPSELREAFGHFPSGVIAIAAEVDGVAGSAWRRARSCRCRWTRRWCRSACRTRRPRGPGSRTCRCWGSACSANRTTPRPVRSPPRRATGSPVWSTVSTRWCGVHRRHQRVAGERHRTPGPGGGSHHRDPAGHDITVHEDVPPSSSTAVRSADWTPRPGCRCTAGEAYGRSASSSR